MFWFIYSKAWICLFPHQMLCIALNKHVFKIGSTVVHNFVTICDSMRLGRDSLYFSPISVKLCNHLIEFTSYNINCQNHNFYFYHFRLCSNKISKKFSVALETNTFWKCSLFHEFLKCYPISFHTFLCLLEATKKSKFVEEIYSSWSALQIIEMNGKYFSDNTKSWLISSQIEKPLD